MSTTERDLDYYKNTIKKMYQHYFWKRIILVSLAFLLLSISTVTFSKGRVFNILLLGVLFVFILYLFKSMNNFQEVLDVFLKENTPNLVIKKMQESEYTYNIIMENAQTIGVNKKDVRNLPSNDKKYTLMVGFTKGFFVKNPCNINYYDILEITYEEKFRLKRNGYNKLSKVPRFLRKFTFQNMLSSSKHLISFIVGNIFAIYIIIQLVNLLIAMFYSYKN